MVTAIIFNISSKDKSVFTTIFFLLFLGFHVFKSAPCLCKVMFLCLGNINSISMDVILIGIGGILATFLASYLGAYFAYRYNYQMSLKNDKKQIFQVLMMYRNITVYDLDFIKALNSIDSVFYHESKIRNLYHDYLNKTSETPSDKNNTEIQQTLYKLLFEMAKSIGYQKLTIKEIENFYTPEIIFAHYHDTILKMDAYQKLKNQDLKPPVPSTPPV